jgi:hypothetical protein
MRGVRSFLILVLILAGLGAYLYFVESKRTPGDEGPQKEKVFGVDTEKIEEIAITSEAGDRTTVRKTGDGWEIVAPAKAPADPAEISGLLTNLSSLEMQSVVDENAPDLKEYGLAEPRITVSFKADGQDRTLQIGQKTPPGTDLYAKRGNENKVFLISSFLDSTFNRSTFDLRDKAVVKVERDKLDAVEVAAGSRTMRFVRTGGEWRIAQPVEGRADFGAVEGLVGRVTGLQMKSVASAGGGDLKEFGLDAPTATVRMNAGSSQATLLVGGSADEGAVYVKDASRPAVYTADASIVEELKKAPADFRQKDLFDARAFNANRVEIVRGGQTIVLEKTRTRNKDGQEEEKWRQTSPGEPRDLDQAKADALVSAITGARATEFADAAAAKTAIERPEMTVTIKFDDGKKEERVVLGRAGADAFASRSSEAAIAKIETSSLDSIVKALDDLK